MSSELGAISSYVLAIQQMQMSLIKNSVDAQKQAIDILLGTNSERSAPPSDVVGTNVDVKI